MNKKIIKKINLIKGAQTIYLDKIYPIVPLSIPTKYLIDDFLQEEFLGVYYANVLIIEAEKEEEVEILLGKGFVAESYKEFDELFIKTKRWAGGDGIFTFNIENGLDCFDLEESYKTLMVFGDTFVGSHDPKTLKRLQPHLMPNNSMGFLEEGKMSFHLNRGELGNIEAFYKIDPSLDISGTLPMNLVNYDLNQDKNIGYLSAYDALKPELIFDLHVVRKIDALVIQNYYSDEADWLSSRGVKSMIIEISEDKVNWEKVDVINLKPAKDKSDEQKFSVNLETRFIRMTLLDHYGDEGLFGLNRVKFMVLEQVYRDIFVESNSVLSIEGSHSWLWLQDGVVIDNDLYFLPLIVTSDHNQPEGLQFAVNGVTMIKTPIENGEVLTERSTQKYAPIMVDLKDSQLLFGAGIMPYTKESGFKEGDGYIYIYGYKTTLGLRELVVARVQPEDFSNIDDWRYFDGDSFTSDITSAKPILPHVSCELSVSPLLEGEYSGKFLAVFTYDTNTPYIAFAIGETPFGPFTKPQIIYHTKEQEIFKSTTYTYNAKAHPHLSRSKEVLVSYNTNTYNFDHNMSSRLIYGPRFILLKSTE